MLKKQQIDEYNCLLLNKLSLFLNNYSNAIKEDMIISLMSECNLSKEEAYRYLLVSFLEIDNKEIIEFYIKDMVKQLDIKKYQNNPYYQNIKIDNVIAYNYAFKKQFYEPYEAFVYDDLKQYGDGRIVPQIGFFDEIYYYPAILENNREWMLITPNEIETMQSVIDESFGHVLTYGLGLGYFSYMVSLKENVFDITIVEKDSEVIELFKKYILPQFENKDKIKIIQADAFDFAIKDEFNYDFVFADIWHDPSDGVELYLKFKNLEKENIIYRYWIEKTLKCYL